MTTTKWVFTDTVVSGTYTFEVNPNDGGSPTKKKTISQQATTASDGSAIVFEGQPALDTGQFSGTVLSQTQYQTIITWFKKKYPINYTDDLGRTFTIYITQFAPKRQRSSNFPWKHTYTVDYLVLVGE